MPFGSSRRRTLGTLLTVREWLLVLLALGLALWGAAQSEGRGARDALPPRS
jgi:hypothetical protein